MGRRGRHQGGALLALVWALFALACSKSIPPGRDAVNHVDLVDADSIDADELEDKLATAGSTKFLGLFRGIVYEYEIFDDNTLARDLERVERYYRARGFYEAKVTAGRVIRIDEKHVRVEIRVHEGPRVTVRSANPEGIATLPHEVATAATKAITLDPGEPFDEAEFELSKRRILEVLGDAGFAFAKVTHEAEVDLVTHEADVVFHVDPGPISEYGSVTFAGLESLPEGQLRAVLGIREGARYSRKELVDGQDALQNLGVFASVEIVEDKRHPESHRVPITVRVAESELRTIRLGGGARFDVLRLENHLRAGWEHKNFLGGMRTFGIEAQPGFTYFPTRIGRFEAPTRLLPEFRLHSALRQPSFLEARTTGFIAAEYNVYPLLYPLPDDIDPETERILGYQEVKASTGVERAFFSHHLFVTPSYNWQANFPFAYQSDVPAGIDTVRVSFPELFAILDFRDDRLEAHDGFYISNSFQVAGYIFGGTVSDVRLRPEVRLYRWLVKAAKVSLAMRVTTGFLFPDDYGETLTEANALQSADPAVVEAATRDQHKLLFRAFYSGGPNSNRGYPFRGVGPHGPVGFLVPTGANCSVPLDQLPSACIRPLGGLTLWEASMEVRFPIFGPLFGATFVDASDVTRRVGEIRFDVPHISPGFGLRYRTPVGPLRFDVGVRVPGWQQIGKDELDEDEGNPGEVFGLPIAVHIALGEAY
jgi:outer membrane protein insertion porin family/translocation and assembly module TamA